jgi:hypothetical protein
MKLKAIRPIHGDYGTIKRGEVFEVSEDVGLTLESRGLAEYVREAKSVKPPENKMLLPDENKGARKLR